MRLQNLDERSLLEVLRSIAKAFGVRVRFYHKVNYDFGACCQPSQRVMAVWVWAALDRRTLVSNFFHELGHQVDYDRGRFPGYYAPVQTKTYLRRYSLRAELSADETGAELMRQFFPDTKFDYTYRYKCWQRKHREYWGIA